MSFNFHDRTNSQIDKLVEISWRESNSHANDVFLTRVTDESNIMEVINDKIDVSETNADNSMLNLRHEGKTQAFDESQAVGGSRAVIAVDTGLVHLGDFIGGGIAFAIRGAAICRIGNQQETILRYNTGPILADQQNLVPALRFIGKRLGNEELYLDKLADGRLIPREHILGDANQVEDRYRNFVERMIQEEAIGIMIANKQGLLLIDGALPAGTYDTPVAYLQRMLDVTVDNLIDVVGISKKTRITIAGKPLSSLFDEKPALVGYMPLTAVMTAERSELIESGLARKTEDISLGNELYAARFGLGPPALTFRVDVKNSKRSTPDEVINNVFSDCQIHGCYPKPLIEAHQHSSFLYQDVQLLLADLVVRTGARPKERQSMDWLFAPVGSFGK